MNYNDPLQREEPITIHTDEEKDSVIIRGRTSAAKFVNFLHALPEHRSNAQPTDWFSGAFSEGYRSGQAYIVLSAEGGHIAHWDGSFGQRTLRRINRLIKHHLHYAEGMTTLCLELSYDEDTGDTDEWYNLALSRAHNESQDGEETIEVKI
jgi:hypothetical protein